MPVDVREKIKDDTYHWLRKYSIRYDKLFFVHKKIEFCDRHGISIIIEDKGSTVIEAVKSGKHAILVDRRYNRDLPKNICRAFSFNDVLENVDL